MNFDIDKEKYDIYPELKVRDILNEHSLNEHSDKIYTNKNYDDMYDYDLVVKDIELDMFLGFIEVEHSNYKYFGGRNWYHSFLKRKVLEYDRVKNCFTTRLKDNAYKTIYIKFNKNYSLNDCICCDMKTISELSSGYQNKTSSNYKNCVFRTTMNDERVKVGIDNCIEYIEKYFEKMYSIV